MSALSNGSLARPASAPAAGTRTNGAQRSLASAQWAILLAAVIGALAVQLLRSTNPDVSWLLTVNDRVLAGAKPYVDVIEVNPPASILLYALPAALAKILSVRSESVLIALLTAAIAGAMVYVGGIVKRYRLTSQTDNFLLLTIIAFVIAILPLSEFAQREHFATLFLLPYAFVAIARAQGAKINWADGLSSGILLGLAIAIKPHFALCAALVATYQILRSKSLRPVFSIEHVTAGAVAIAYLITSLIFFPKFFSDMAPLLADLYLPPRNDLALLIGKIGFAILLPLVQCWIYRNGERRAGMIILLLIAAGFFAAYLIQGKGWDNHAYPVVAFCLLAAAWATQAAIVGKPGLGRKLGVFALAAAAVVAIPRFDKPGDDNPALAAAVSRLAAHPKLLALGFMLRLGHPLTRDIGGTWVGHVPCLWMTGGAMVMKERVGDDATLRARADAYFERDRLIAAQDIETQRPDILLIEKTNGFDFPEWIAGSPRLRAAMQAYELADTVGRVQIFKLKNESAG